MKPWFLSLVKVFGDSNLCAQSVPYSWVDHVFVDFSGDKKGVDI